MQPYAENMRADMPCSVSKLGTGGNNAGREGLCIPYRVQYKRRRKTHLVSEDCRRVGGRGALALAGAVNNEARVETVACVDASAIRHLHKFGQCRASGIGPVW